MTLRKNTAISIAAAMLLCMTGCNDIKQTSPYLEKQAISYGTTTTGPTASVYTKTSTSAVLPVYTEISLDVPELAYEEVELIYQAEDMPLPVLFECKNEKIDYTGSGYVCGLSGELQNSLIFELSVPSAQHYDISLVVCADNGAECTVTINDSKTEDLAIESSDRFVRITIPGIYMEAGANKLSITQKDGDMLLDCVELRSNTSLSEEEYIPPVPVNEEASEAACDLFTFLCDNYGKKIISGQHVADSGNDEIKRIAETTGKYPVIRFADMYPYSNNGGNLSEDDTIDAALEWSKDGGITGLMWHWFSPSGEPGTLEKSEDFSLSAAVTFENVAVLTPKALEELHKSGNISDECMMLIKDIDSVSEGLKKLRDEDVPVLWRPLHQAGTGSYWWDSEGSDVYKWLWNLLYVRMTEYHKLDNLLWVWSGTSSEYMPDSSRFDIAAADFYCEEGEEFGSGYEPYHAIDKMSYGKLTALSECGSLPDIPAAFRDKSVWSYFGLWYYPYLTDEDNEFVDSEALIKVYNSEGVLTREDYIEYCSSREEEEEEESTEAATEAPW